jgi:hypothetical protein
MWFPRWFNSRKNAWHPRTMANHHARFQSRTSVPESGSSLADEPLPSATVPAWLWCLRSMGHQGQYLRRK